MKPALLLILASCVPQADKAVLNTQVQRGLQWLRIAQGYTNGCISRLKSDTKEERKKCNLAGTEYADKVFPLAY